MIRFYRSLTKIGRAVIGLLLLALIVTAFLALDSCQSARIAKTEARLGRNQTGAALASGADAVGSIGEQIAAEGAIDATTKENTDAIRSAPGADAPVPAAVDAVARERLCRRAAYRERPECLQQPPAP